MVSITVEDLTKIFPPKVVALDNVNLDVRDKEFLVVLGPSGSGKTTFLRILAGLEVPTRGRVLIGDKEVVMADGRKVRKYVPPQERDVGMVFQNWALYPHMKVFDNIAFPLQVRRVPKEEIRRRVKEITEVLGIDFLLDRYPRQLSGGQQQRVALARALVKSPQVLLLDEPFSNLDARVRITARTFVRRIQKKLGITTILVTHDQADAFAVGDRIMVLNKGKVIQFGTPEDLYERPVNVFVANFIGEPPINLVKVPVEGGVIKYFNIRLDNYDEGEVVVGVRPDEAAAYRNLPLGERGVSVIKGRVELCEYIGSREYVTVDIGGGNLVRVFVPGKTRFRGGEEVVVVLKKVHLFRASNNERVTTLSVEESETSY